MFEKVIMIKKINLLIKSYINSKNYLSNELYLIKLIKSSQPKNIPIIYNLMINNDININFKDSKGMTPLMYAVKNNNLELVQHLIKKNANSNIRNNLGKSVISIIPEYNFLFILNTLLQANDIHEVINDTDEHGRTAILKATSMGDFDLVEKLIHSGSDIEIPDCYNFTPIMQATFNNDLPMIKLLIKYKNNHQIKNVDNYNKQQFNNNLNTFNNSSEKINELIFINNEAIILEETLYHVKSHHDNNKENIKKI